ncbi:uncharacterized protein EV154DRAFT_415510 [Mucor mucedo]|uniref:uncharacterized protein n=1 Tax=Mucor mucedo TaxID=29922 RepID=UPI0022207D35|nr:uncharacterized protein EV154DRAFT_415510 [Mucor mucedo]KAI7894131.1 hypothetical protein EV154DRAFT_415510 [Mucor mucedo]
MNELLSIFIGGENRIVLPFLLYPVILVIPSILLAGLVVIPHDKFPSAIKQILSIPLLLAVFMTPFGFTNGNRIIDLVAGVTNYNLFLRFFELCWVGPLVQHRPVYATPESLWIDFWGCLRTFPKPAKEDTKDLKKGEKYYHILINLVIHLIEVDIICSWMTTFTSNEFCATWFERPKLFFAIYFFANLVLNGAFNSVGFSLHLFYCLVFEGGSYSSVFMGEQCIFFLGHGLGVFFEHVVELVVAPKLSKEFKDSFACYLIKRIWTMAFGYYTFYYIFNGFMAWGFQFDSPLTFSQPAIIKLVQTFPVLRDFVGTNILI